MKNLKFNKKNEEGKIIEEIQLTIPDGNGNEVPIQCKDFLNTEEYFKVSMMANDENKPKAAKEQGYFMMKTLIINPKIDDVVINQLPWEVSMKIMRALNETFLPEDSFLELGVPLSDISLEKEE